MSMRKRGREGKERRGEGEKERKKGGREGKLSENESALTCGSRGEMKRDEESQTAVLCCTGRTRESIA